MRELLVSFSWKARRVLQLKETWAAKRGTKNVGQKALRFRGTNKAPATRAPKDLKFN